MILNRQMKSFAIGATAAVMAGISMLSASAQAAVLSGRVSLSDLLAGNSYVLGDKLFDNFRDFVRIATGGAVAPTAAEIFVTGAINGSSYDLLFESDRWNVTAGQFIDTGFRYDVTVTDPAQAITSAGVSIKDAYTVTGTGRVVVTDTIRLLDPFVAGSENILVRSVSGRDSEQVALLPPQTKISVAKDIAIVGGTGTANLGRVTQSDIQRTPESGNLLELFAVSGIGVAVVGKKLKLKTTILN